MHSRPSLISHAVFNTMSGTNATLERFAWLGDGMATAIWQRETEEELTSYVQPGHHTLSCYLGGGYRIERADVPGRFGAPQQLCSMPDWHESQWVVRGHVRMLHVYFMPEHFTRRAVVELDREPRELTLADRTYFENPRIVQLCESLLAQSWQAPDDLLRANEISHEALSELLRSQAIVRRDLRLRGGLAPLVRRRLADYIEQHLAQSITLGELAQLACLSEFHLARMFRVSFGMPPSSWVAQRRIERARALLKAGKLPLQQVAAACGYADLSHFSHRFSKAVGAPPGRYRQALLE
ncbi:helix-turn-helix domain-containing protein [Massilia genomosp. 1]|uniref:Helix-turn-helix domain-containing protein n=1 Tax=Massilia genomosp. 1 TaxID=2609280 RepID=A0ABX0MET4_9BURK|nr:helix-turn-helix domain-containing protein [Massilia genomosp. 1]